MPHSVRQLIEAFGTDEFRAGDTVVNNMPYGAGAGSHLPDVTMVTPIVFEGQTVGYAGNLAHHADVGGSTPGSFAADNKTIFQEGLQIPPVKLYEDDTLREEIMEFILTNVRTPEERRGDLRAQYGSNRTGRERLLELVEEWSVETIEAAFEALLDYSEARTRKSIRDLPDGEYSFADTMDGDGRETNDVRIAADVDISDGTITVDLSDSDEQVPGVINAPFSVTRATVYYVVRCVTDPEIPPNDGCYRPISVVAPEGSVVRPQRPAAVAGGIETEQRIADVLFGALESAGVRPVMAAANGSMSTVTFGGARPDDDSPYTYYETIGGGYGARTDRDGVHGVHAHLTNTQNTPIEAFEMSYPLRVERYALRQDTGGAGTYQGGMGIRRDIRVLDHVADFSLMSERRRSRPYGLAGGKKGSKGADFHVSNGERTRIDAKTTRELQTGNLVSVRTPVGGG
jgi:N-methylhydantoinase B